VPAGKLGSELQGFINQNTGSKNSTSEIPISIALGGTYKEPRSTLLTQEQTAQVKEALTNVAEEKGEKALEGALKGDKPEDIIGGLLGTKKDTSKIKKDSTQVKGDTTKTDVKQETQKVLQDKLQNLLKKKKKN